MVSRRRFLAALGVSTAGLSGCQFRDEERPETPPDTVQTETQTRIPSETQPPTATPDRETDSPTQTAEPTPTESPLADRFDTIYDVTEAGADPTGSELVDDTLNRLIGDDTLLQFPPGTYRMEDIAVEDVRNFGMVGHDATLQLDRRGRAIFMRFNRVADILVDGFSIDNTADNTAAWFDLKCTGGDNVVRNYTVEGFVDVYQQANGFTIMVEGSDTSLELDNVDLSKGAITSTATFVFPRREYYDPSRGAGSLTFRNCKMKNWGNEGLYASTHEGPLKIIGGEYANNGIVQVRIGGGNAPERAIVRDVSVTTDEIPEYMPDQYRILRGIWLKEGDGALVENCDVTLKNLSREQTPAAILVKDQFGRATIRDCDVTVEGVSRPAVRIQKPADTYEPRWMPSLDHLPSEWDVTIENLTIDGTSPNTEAIRIEGRDGCTVRDVTIDKQGEDVDGLYLRNVGDCLLEGGSMTTHRFPVLVDFADDDDCVLELSNASLTGTEVESEGSKISDEASDTYCIGSDALPRSNAGRSDRLALTKTEKSEDVKTPTQTELYGRWLPR